MDQSGRNKRRVTVDDGDSDDERALSRGSGNGGGSQSRRVTVDDGESDDEHAAQLRARSRGSGNGGGSRSDKKKIASHVGPFGMRIPDDSELVFPPGVDEAPPTKAEGQKKRRPAYASLSADSLHPGALPPAQRMLFAAAGASAPSPIALPAAEFARLTPAEQAEQRALEREYAQRLSQKAERESAQAFTDERVRQVEQARAGVVASWSDPSRKGMTILTPEQVAWRRAAGTYVERGAKTLGNGKVAVREPQALAGLRASEARERLEAIFLRRPTNEAQAVKSERARAHLAYLDYVHAFKEDPDRQHPQAFVDHYKDRFAKQTRWRNARNDRWEFARYDGLHDFKKQHGLLDGPLRAKRGSVAAAARATVGVGHADLDRQQASFRGDGGMPSETVDEDEEAKKVKTAADTQFNVYLLPHPQKGEALKAVPDRATVERALASEPFESLTWREILKRYAPTEEVGLGRRFQYDELPRALRHGGVVLMRQRATELSKPNRAFVFPYLKAWMFEGAANMERAAFIEAEVERFRRERALSASRGDLFHGEEGTGGFTDEAAVIAHAQLDFDRYLQRLEADDSEEAVAARAKAEKEERARRAHAASIREAFLTQEPRDNDSSDGSDSDDSSSDSSSDAEPYRPPAGDGGGFH